MDRQALQAVAAVALLAIAVLAPALVAQAPPSAIKLATVVPQGSIWDKNLKQMGDEWKDATGGRITVTVYSGGSQGDESTALRKMRLDALQAAAFTVVGLGQIDWAFNVFDIPFFFDSYDELNYVTDELTPVLRKRIEPKGFMLLNWGHGGWTQIFTKKPVQTVDDLRHIKLWTSAGNDKQVQWFKANGFQPRPMAMTDILTGLTTGMLEGLPTTPLAASLFQWDKQTPYMLELGLAPVVGAGVITTKAWNAIPAADKPKLLAAANGVEQRLRVEVPKLDANAVEQMTKRGLTVTKATGPEWRTQLDDLAKTMRGESVPPDIFDLALKARTEYRKQHPAAPPPK
ncbi:MAG: TRAP transporter substrate-binding protein DctP [Acidobacteriia bacterium]|nr:TRAP transporter substrate-binding protein DctP [Terriglobia bacterium]